MQKSRQQEVKPPPVLYPKEWKDYELLDSGNFRKLERFGPIISDRPETTAAWPKSIAKQIWEKADLYFHEEKGQKGKWKNKENFGKWQISYPLSDCELKLILEQTAFKHLGVFPEQAINWEYIHKHCCRILQNGSVCNVLNLFAYTGAASIAAGLAGANVTHVDSVKQIVNWANENAKTNHLENIRWIVEDARKFVKRAIKRGDKFQGVIMDPPAFGMSGKANRWKLEKDLPALLAEVLQLMDRKNSFFVLNTYSPTLDHQKLRSMLSKINSFPKLHEMKVLGLKSKSGKLLPLGNLIRFYS